MSEVAAVDAVKEPKANQEELSQWFEAAQQLAKWKDLENKLRVKIFGDAFTNPREGTNKFALADGWVMNGTYVINRKVDVASLKNLGDEFAESKIPTDALFKYEPTLVKSAYNLLTDEQRLLVDRALIIKPGTPQLEIKLPKRG